MKALFRSALIGVAGAAASWLPFLAVKVLAARAPVTLSAGSPPRPVMICSGFNEYLGRLEGCKVAAGVTAKDLTDELVSVASQLIQAEADRERAAVDLAEARGLDATLRRALDAAQVEIAKQQACPSSDADPDGARAAIAPEGNRGGGKR